MSHTVVGIFNNVVDAEKAVDQLLSNGFDRNRIDIADHTDREGHADEHRDRDDDSIGGFFSSLFGGDSDESRYHTEAAKQGSVVTVHAQSNEEAERAADILDDFGTIDANELAGARTTTADRDVTSADLENDQTIDVVEEELHVGKRQVNTGGVRVRSRIVERPVEESIRLRSEHVHVERRPVDRAATEADLANFKEGTIEMTETAESAVVSKDARVVEEIHLDKDVEEHEEVVRDTVRSTEVDIDETTGDRRDLLAEDDRLSNDPDRRDR
jgi:uncharacterized protein (TIGR02271 family)